MSHQVVDPCEYINNGHWVESEIVRFLFRPRISQLDIVLVYAGPMLDPYFKYLKEGGDPKNYRVTSLDYRLFSFRGVAEVLTNLEPHLPKSLEPRDLSDEGWKAHEQTLISPRGRLVMVLECESANEHYRCEIVLDTFGSHLWSFASLDIGQKMAQVVWHDTKCEYWDAERNVLFNRADPFQDEM